MRTTRSPRALPGLIVTGWFLVSLSAILLGAGPTPPATKPGRVDLLKDLDYKAASPGFAWTMKGGSLFSDSAYGSQMRLPYRPPAEYDLLVEFTRLEGRGDLAFSLVQGEAAFSWLLQGANSTAFVSLDECIDARDNASAVKLAAALKEGTRHQVIIKVRKAALGVALDGKAIFDQKMDYARLKPVRKWSVGNGLLGLVTAGTKFQFHAVSVLEISEAGERVDLKATTRPSAGK